jgi:hypothetical protein
VPKQLLKLRHDPRFDRQCAATATLNSAARERRLPSSGAGGDYAIYHPIMTADSRVGGRRRSEEVMSQFENKALDAATSIACAQQAEFWRPSGRDKGRGRWRAISPPLLSLRGRLKRRL